MATTSPGSVLRSSDQLNEVVSLAHALLPPLPDSSTLILEDQPTVAEVNLCTFRYSLPPRLDVDYTSIRAPPPLLWWSFDAGVIYIH